MDVFVKILLVALGVIAISAAIIVIYRRISAALTADSILKYGRASEKFVYNLLKTQYSENRLLHGVTLPLDPANRSGPRTEVDLIAVGRGGVCIIEVKGHKGFIENPIKGDWCQVYGEKVLPFRSPFEQNAGHLRAIERIFKAEHVYNVPLLNMVVFTDNGVKFKNRHDNLYTADNLLPSLRDINRSRFMSGSELKKATAAIRKYAKRAKNFRPKPPQDNKAQPGQYSVQPNKNMRQPNTNNNRQQNKRT
jgi:Nuclease-related domain.